MIWRGLASIGPGFVFVLTVLGAGDIVANVTAGAGYGYHRIWALGMTLIFRFVWVNASAKYVLVTGESLLAGYGRIGPSPGRSTFATTSWPSFFQSRMPQNWPAW